MIRLDQFLTNRGLATSRSLAKRLIESGGVRLVSAVGEHQVLTKAGHLVDEDAQIEVADLVGEARFASRSGLKLEAALAHWQLDVQGLWALDIGQSTGGFTDCLLNRGVMRVTGIDVGSGQLVERLRSDSRVDCFEGVNAREADRLKQIVDEVAVRFSDTKRLPSLAVVDVSFISQRLVLPSLVSVLSPGAAIVSLFKPQFEVGRNDIGGGGVVRKQGAAELAIRALIDWADACGLKAQGDPLASPIAGTDGNSESLIYFRVS